MITHQETMMAEMRAGHEEMMAMLGAHHERSMACLGNTETTDEEMDSETGNKEVPKEDAVVKPVEGRKKRQTGRNLAEERRQKPKDGSRRKLAATRRGTNRRAKVARRKGNVVGENRTRDNVVRGTPKGRTLERRQRAQEQCDKGIRKRDVKELRLEMLSRHSGRQLDWTSRSELPDLRLGCERSTTGPYGGVGPIRNC
jgi:hypothetical protein